MPKCKSTEYKVEIISIHIPELSFFASLNILRYCRKVDKFYVNTRVCDFHFNPDNINILIEKGKKRYTVASFHAMKERSSAYERKNHEPEERFLNRPEIRQSPGERFYSSSK